MVAVLRDGVYFRSLIAWQMRLSDGIYINFIPICDITRHRIFRIRIESFVFTLLSSRVSHTKLFSRLHCLVVLPLATPYAIRIRALAIHGMRISRAILLVAFYPARARIYIFDISQYCIG